MSLYERIDYHGSMGTWLDDANPTPAVRGKLAEFEAEWREHDRRLEAEPTPDERDKMLGRIDEIEYDIDELVSKR